MSVLLYGVGEAAAGPVVGTGLDDRPLRGVADGALMAIDAVTSADMSPSIASRSAASAPNPGATAWGASMKPVQKRTGLTSALSHDSQEVVPGGLAAAQLASSTLLPAPADPTTTVRCLPAPAASRSCSAGLMTSVAGNAVGRNFASANRRLCEASCLVASPCTTPPFRNSC